jgi:hypothetical protein
MKATFDKARNVATEVAYIGMDVNTMESLWMMNARTRGERRVVTWKDGSRDVVCGFVKGKAETRTWKSRLCKSLYP